MGNINKMDAGTPTGTPAETPDGNEYFPPCRLAEVFITECPRCGREMRVKMLRYSHVCRRSFDPTERAREMQVVAEQAINKRMALIEQPAKRCVQHTAAHTQQNTDRQSNYAKFILF